MLRSLSCALGAVSLLMAAAYAQQRPDSNSPVSHILNRCVKCHSGPSAAGGLNLTSRVFSLKGGKSGPAFIDRNPEKSLLFTMAASRKMPPGAPLSGGEIEELR